MKRWILASLLVALSTALLIPAARAQSTDNDGCSDATLRGDYAFRISGENFLPGGAKLYVDGVAMTEFDGAGKLSQVDFIMGNGVPRPGPADPLTGFDIHEQGTYTVNVDCTGSATIDFPIPPKGTSGAVLKLMFVIGNAGRTVHAIVSEFTLPNTTTPLPSNIHSDAQRVSSTPTSMPMD
ncbi:MAG TPA: hypothetical protein VKS20_12530 [Candidatus Acidoferrales bacterium]|nr:hypothetical protein [Candidatus Acidoferrales bacterium]